MATQMIKTLQHIHSKGVIVRKLSTSNIQIKEINDKKIYYITDFSGIKKYMKLSSKQLIKESTNVPFIGIPTYASINALLRNEQSRRDDLESLAYILIHMYLGKFEMENTNLNNNINKMFEDIIKKKRALIEDNNKNKKIPEQLFTFLSITSKLQYKEEPNYDKYISLFSTNISNTNDSHSLKNNTSSKSQDDLSNNVKYIARFSMLNPSNNVFNSLNSGSQVAVENSNKKLLKKNNTITTKEAFHININEDVTFGKNKINSEKSIESSESYDSSDNDNSNSF